MDKRLIVILGLSGSGKGTVTDHLKQRGWPVVHLGQMVYDEVEKRGLNIVEHEKQVREDMRHKDGPRVLAIRACARAEQHFEEGANIVVFDGLYSWEEYLYVLDKYGDGATFIAIFTPKIERHKRVIARKDSRRKYSLEDINKRDMEEVGGMHQKGGPIAMADYTVVNDGTVEDLNNSIDRLIDPVI